MIKIRKASERGHFDFGWLDTYHTFSFGEYRDEKFKGFQNLRVINEDFIQAEKGFPTHAHRDMEILTYVISGALAHKDSMGNGSTIFPGDIQHMSAGTGVEHSEYSASKKESTHILQIWIFPSQKGLAPRYGQKNFPESQKKNQLCLLASGTGERGSIEIRQDVKLYSSILTKSTELKLGLDKGRHSWVQIVGGELTLNGEVLRKGDGAAISNTAQLTFKGVDPSTEFLVFDLN